VGSGKTTLIQDLIDGLDHSVVLARIHQTQLDELEFFQAVLVEFGFKPFGKGKVELLDMLNSYLVEQHRQGRHVLLIVDEAQNLTPRVLEEVRLMTGLETAEGKLINLILAGQPELRDLLDAPGMEQLNQRIRFRFHLKPLAEEEIADYIRHRLRVAGYEGESDLFPAELMPLIHRYTGGVPRLINILCDTALISAYVDQLHAVDAAVVEQAIEELQWTPYHERSKPKPSSVKEAMAEAMHTPPRLIVHTPDGDIVEFPLEQEVVTVGRLPFTDLELRDPSVSGHHAKIITLHGTSFLEDLRSTNGTYVNGQRVLKCVLRNGDMISIGRHRLRYVVDSGTEQTPQPQLAPVDSTGTQGTKT
jgi:type II secretory pathway predicted ATPase ExeA